MYSMAFVKEGHVKPMQLIITVNFSKAIDKIKYFTIGSVKNLPFTVFGNHF